MMTTMPQRGFTLVETLVAISIIALAIIGPLYAVQQALNASRIARDVLIASSLAQEAVEYVRSMRDGNYLYSLKTDSDRPWLYGLDGSGGTKNCFAAACVIDPTQATVELVSQTPATLYRTAAGIYNHQTGTASGFSRTVRLESVSATEVVLTVTVSWTLRGAPQTLTISERLYDWL